MGWEPPFGLAPEKLLLGRPQLILSLSTSALLAIRPSRIEYGARVNPLSAVAAAFAQWVVPDLPLYGNDKERGDLAP